MYKIVVGIPKGWGLFKWSKNGNSGEDGGT